MTYVTKNPLTGFAEAPARQSLDAVFTDRELRDQALIYNGRSADLTRLWSDNMDAWRDILKGLDNDAAWRGGAAKATSGHINLAAISYVIEKYGWCDRHLPQDLKDGFLVANCELRETGIPNWDLIPEESRSPGNDRSKWARYRETPPDWQEEDLLKATWEKVKAQEEKGLLTRIPVPPVGVGQKFAAFAGHHVAYMFGIRQPTEENPHKTRAISDMRGANSTVTSTEKLWLPSHSLFFSFGHYLASGGRCDLSPLYAGKSVIHKEMDYCVARKRDWVPQESSAGGFFRTPGADVPAFDIRLALVRTDVTNAYPNLAAKDVENNRLACWNPEADPPSWQFFESKAMVFGSVSSVYAWCRVAEFARFAIQKVLGIPVLVYIDDFFTITLKGCEDKCLELIIEFLRTLGLTCAPEKSDAGSSMNILGMTYSCPARNKFVAYLSPQAKTRIVKQIDKAAEAARAPAVPVMPLMRAVGGCIFPFVLYRWAGVYASVQPVFNLYRELERDDAIKLNKFTRGALMKDLDNMRRLVLGLGIVEFDAVPKFATLITDASYSKETREATLVATLILDDRVMVLIQDVPEDLLDTMEERNWNVISFLETVCLTVTLKQVGHLLQGRVLSIWTDNSAALFATAKGGSACHYIRAPATATKELCAAWSIPHMLRYVPSGWNPADGPTRKRTIWAFKKLWSEWPEYFVSYRPLDLGPMLSFLTTGSF